MERIVLAYSGGLDTTIAVRWLVETRDAEIVAVTLDMGQGGELNAVRERALAAGAGRAHVLDARDEFARDYVLRALQAGALYQERYPLAAALARPLIARHLVEVAAMEGAGTVAHGGSSKGNGQARLELSIRALDPALAIVAPTREAGLTRAEALAYAAARGLAVPATAERPYSTDANLWGRSAGCGALEDPWHEPPADVYTLTRGPERTPAQPATIEIAYERGVPVALNGVAMALAELIEAVGTIAGHHGVGRIDIVEDRILGIKAREVHEAPAAVVLHAAHRELERFVTSRELARLSRYVGAEYADLVYNGFWFTPARDAMDAFVASVQQRVTGDVRLRVWRGSCAVVGRRSPHGLYDRALATYDGGDRFDHAAAAGFIRIWGLPVEAAARAGVPSIAPLTPQR